MRMKRWLPVVLAFGAIAAAVAVTQRSGEPPPEPTVVTTDFSSGAGAADEGLPTNEEWNEWDADRDGKISADEFAQRSNDMAFDRRDLNGDGFLTREDRGISRRGRGRGRSRSGQMEKFIQRATVQMIEDGTDHLTVATFPGPQDAFVRLDANGDGFVVQDELDAFQPRRRGRREARPEPRDTAVEDSG